MKRIKICHVLNIINGKADGVFTHLLMLLQSLDTAKFEQIVVYHGDENVESIFKRIGVKSYIVKSLGGKNIFSSMRGVITVLKSENVDVIHSHMVKPYLICGLINIITRKCHVFNYNGVFIDNEYYNRFQKYLLYTINSIICISKSVNLAVVPSLYSKRILLEETGLFPKIDVYYNSYADINPSDEDYLITNELLTLKQKYFVVGIIARIEIQKRIDLSLKLLKIIKKINPSVYFVFMGDGPLEKEMYDLSVELGVAGNCKFFGFVKNARNYIKYLDVLLFTSDWEGLPLTFYEAMNESIPIIASDVGGNKEVIQNANCGYVFNKGDIQNAAELLLGLNDTPAKRMELGKNGKQALKEIYSLNSFKTFFENLYFSFNKK